MSAAAPLIELLLAEEAALARGDLTVVLSLQGEKERLVARVERQGAHEAQLSRVASLARANGEKLRLARDAARQAAERLSAIGRKARRVGYDAAGDGLDLDENAARRV